MRLFVEVIEFMYENLYSKINVWQAYENVRAT